jgi:hypothetical protein
MYFICRSWQSCTQQSSLLLYKNVYATNKPGTSSLLCHTLIQPFITSVKEICIAKHKILCLDIVLYVTVPDVTNQQFVGANRHMTVTTMFKKMELTLRCHHECCQLLIRTILHSTIISEKLSDSRNFLKLLHSIVVGLTFHSTFAIWVHLLWMFTHHPFIVYHYLFQPYWPLSVAQGVGVFCYEVVLLFLCNCLNCYWLCGLSCCAVWFLMVCW